MTSPGRTSRGLSGPSALDSCSLRSTRTTSVPGSHSGRGRCGVARSDTRGLLLGTPRHRPPDGLASRPPCIRDGDAISTTVSAEVAPAREAEQVQPLTVRPQKGPPGTFVVTTTQHRNSPSRGDLQGQNRSAAIRLASADTFSIQPLRSTLHYEKRVHDVNSSVKNPPVCPDPCLAQERPADGPARPGVLGPTDGPTGSGVRSPAGRAGPPDGSPSPSGLGATARTGPQSGPP